MKTKAYAKINIILNVNGKRVDGYHDLFMVNTKIDLCDKIIIKPSKVDKFKMDKNLCPNEQNIGYKAYKLLKDKFDIKNNYSILIKKKIPSEAGLAGGSADAARILLDIIKLEGINISKEELIDIAKEIGADIPYCLYSKKCIVKGVGEDITEINSNKEWIVLLASPSLSFSTKKIFDEIDKIDYSVNNEPNIKEFKDALGNMNNDLEMAAKSLYPEYKLDDIKNIMKNFGAINSQMTGSGSSIYGIYDINEINRAKKCLKELKKNFKNLKCKLCKTISY